MTSDLNNKKLFGKYKVLSLIDKGSFGYIYKGKNIMTNELVAIKAEDWKIKGNFLESEAYFLYYLKHFGIPEIKSFGVYKKYKILVQTLLYKNLEDLSSIYHFNYKDICMIAIQLLDRLEYIHSKYVIHRDLKPKNIMVDLETGSIIYLIDFGLAKKYRSGKTKKHIKFILNGRFSGTVRYSSINANRGAEQSRKDDLESLGYILISLAKRGYLPWVGLNIPNKLVKYARIYKIKKLTKEEDLCSELPKQFCDYMKYVKKLKFEEEPNYNYLRWLFINLLISMKCENDLKFTWISKFKNKNKSRGELSTNIKKNNSSTKRKSSSHKRLLKNITNMQEKKKKMKNTKSEELINYLEEKQNKKSEIINSCSEKDINNNKIENLSEAGTKIAQYNMDIIINDSDEIKFKKDYEKKINENNEKFNIKKYKEKNNINIINVEKKDKFKFLGNNSFEKMSISNRINTSLPKKNNNNIINIKVDKRGKMSQNNNTNFLYKKPENLKIFKMNIKNKSFAKINSKIVSINQKDEKNKELIQKNSKKINISNNNNKNDKISNKNSLYKFEITKQIMQYKNKIINIKNKILDKKMSLKNTFRNKIKYNETYNNSFKLNNKVNSRKSPINYNLTNIKRCNSETHLSFNNEKNKIKTHNYNKLYIYPNSEKEIGNFFRINRSMSFKSEDISSKKFRNYTNSDYQSNIYSYNKKIDNNNDEHNNKILNNIKLISKRNRSRNYILDLPHNSYDSKRIKDKREKFLSFENSYSNNRKYGIKHEHKRENSFEHNKSDIENILQCQNLRSNINIKKNLILPMNFYLSNYFNYRELTHSNTNYFGNKNIYY